MKKINKNSLITISIWLLVVLVFWADISRTIKSVVNRDHSQSTDIEQRNINEDISNSPSTTSSPLPKLEITNPTKLSPTEYYSDFLQLKISTPGKEYTVDEAHYYENADLHWIQINEPRPKDISYLLATIYTDDNQPYKWGSSPYAYPEIINFDSSINSIIAELKIHNIESQHLIYSQFLSGQKYYLTLHKICNSGYPQDSCHLRRIYLFPYEKKIRGKLYPTLVLSINFPLENKADYAPYSEKEIDLLLESYVNSNYDNQLFTLEAQRMIKTQDKIAESLVINE